MKNERLLLFILLGGFMVLLASNVKADVVLFEDDFTADDKYNYALNTSCPTLSNSAGGGYKKCLSDDARFFINSSSPLNTAFNFTFPNTLNSAWYMELNISYDSAPGVIFALMDDIDTSAFSGLMTFESDKKMYEWAGTGCSAQNNLTTALSANEKPRLLNITFNSTSKKVKIFSRTNSGVMNDTGTLTLSCTNPVRSLSIKDPRIQATNIIANVSYIKVVNVTPAVTPSIANDSTVLTINIPLNNSQTHNATPYINFTITAGTHNNISTMMVFLDTNSNPINMINSSNNTRQGNFTIAYYTITSQVSGSINGTYYLKVNGTDNASNVFSTIITFNLTNNINAYNITNVSITPIPLSSGTQVKLHFNLTNKANVLNDLPNQTDNISISDCQWLINNTEERTAGNSTFLNSQNVTLNANISSRCRVNNGFGDTSWTLYVNSPTATVGDTTVPVITAQAISGTSFTTEQRVNVSANCTDNIAVDYVRVEWNRTGAFANDTMSSLGNNVYAYNSLFAVGNYNTTNIYCADGSSNIARDLSNFTFTVTSPPADSGTGGGGGGGGGGTTCPTGFSLNASGGCVNATTIILSVENCNFNNKCEGSIGEDALGCPSDCEFNTNYFFCDDPTQPCIKDTIKRLFTSRSKVLNFSIIILLAVSAIIFIPDKSPIGKFIKKPLLRRK